MCKFGRLSWKDSKVSKVFINFNAPFRQEHKMPKQSLTVLAFNMHPFVNRCFNWRSSRPSTQCLKPGFSIEIFNILSERLNISIEYIDYNHLRAITGHSNLKKQDLIFEALRNGTIDMLSSFNSNSTAFGYGFEATLPLYYSNAKYVVARAKNMDSMFDFFKVYDLWSWTAIFGVFMLVLAIYFLAHRVINKFMFKEKRTSFATVTWQILRFELLQYESINEKLLSLNALIIIFALLNCGLLIQMYNSLITSRTVKTTRSMPFKPNEIMGVLKEGKYSFIFASQLHWWYDEILVANYSPFADVLKNNPIRLAQEFDVEYDKRDLFVLDKVESGRWITILDNELIDRYKHKGYCNFVYMETEFKFQDMHFLMRKGHSLIRKINEVIADERRFKLRTIYRKYFLQESFECESRHRGPKALTITPFFGVLILLGGGLTAGLFSFLLELYFKWKERMEPELRRKHGRFRDALLETMSNSSSLIVLIANSRPFVNDCFNYRSSRPHPDCLKPGFSIEIFNVLSSHLNMSIKYINYEQFLKMTAHLKVKKQDLIFEALRSGTIDVVSSYHTNSTASNNGLQATLPLYYSNTKYVVARKKALNGMFDFFKVYDLYSWLAIFGVLLLVLSIYFIAHKIINKFMFKEKRTSFGNLTWQFVRFELLQYESIHEKLLSLNALILFFALFNCGLLIQMYNSLITTRTVQPVKSMPFNPYDILNVLKDGKYSLIITSPIHSWYREILTAKYSPFADSLKDNPVRLAQDFNVEYDDRERFVLDKVKSGGWITIMDNELTEKHKYWGYCNFVYMNTDFTPQNKSFYMRKGHPMLGRINKVIANEWLIIRLLYRKYFLRDGFQCGETKHGPRPLSMTPFYGLLMLLGGGFTTASLLFLLELYFKWKSRNEPEPQRKHGARGAVLESVVVKY